jgi:FAD:protein FMN transferase
MIIRPTSELRFRAMGSDIHVVLVGGTAPLLEHARHRIEQLELLWSRFLLDSEVSVLNALGADEVSPETVLLIERAVQGWRISGGAFDPLLLDALERAGYDRSFELLVDSGPSVHRSEWRRFGIDAPAVTDIEIDGTFVTLPRGVEFDPGGIGKGLAADLVAEELLALGADGVCVNMGGDLRVVGASPSGDGWTIAIEHPSIERPVALVGLDDGAVATSSVLQRVWLHGGEPTHHLIDPSTGEPSTTDLTLASVVAGECWVAEVLAKAVLLRGSERAFDLIDDTCAALAVRRDGAVLASDRFDMFLGDVELPAHLQRDVA